jgi:tRNA (adenine22-N1)-methyltransferase
MNNNIANKMSERMKAIAGLVTKGKIVADIGCDHAYISIFLLQEGIADKVIAVDVRKGPLDIARENIRGYFGDERSIIDVRLSNGFEKILPGETDAAVIAGMGGLLITDILSRGEALFSEGYELVLSPQSEIDSVRDYLIKNSFMITDEKMLRDEGKYYNIIKAVKVGQTGEAAALQEISDYTPAELLYGKLLLDSKDPILFEKLQYDYDTDMKLMERLSGIDTDTARARLLELNTEIELLRGLLNIQE